VPGSQPKHQTSAIRDFWLLIECYGKTNLDCSRSGLRRSGRAGIHTQIVEYKQGDTTLEGFVAYDDAIPAKRPGILIVHQLAGVTDYEKKRAEMLAQLRLRRVLRRHYGKASARKTRRKPAPRRANTKTTGNCARPGPMPAWNRAARQPLVDSKHSRPLAIVWRHDGD